MFDPFAAPEPSPEEQARWRSRSEILHRHVLREAYDRRWPEEPDPRLGMLPFAAFDLEARGYTDFSCPGFDWRRPRRSP